MIKGPVTVVGDYISADVILQGRFSFLEPAEMAVHALTELHPSINERIRRNPILVTGTCFGYGTGRESPARALRAAGIRAVLGGPFARMFFRNAMNNGILVIDCPEIVADGIQHDEHVEIDLNSSTILWQEHRYSFPPIPSIVRRIHDAGGLIPYGLSLSLARGHAPQGTAEGEEHVSS